MQRLGKNLGGYFGEGIDIQALLEENLAIARKHGWEVESLPCGPGLVLHALRRSPNLGVKVYISSGIHGDEPAGPLALFQLLKENTWPSHIGLWLCPCLNPTGFSLNRRENIQNQDLNRDYLHLQTAEIRAHVAWLEAQPCFVIYAAFRYAQADIEYVARQELLRILVYATLFFAILNNLHTQESTRIVALTLLFLGMLIAVYGVYQYLSDSQRIWHFIKPSNYARRGSGTYINPNHFAGFLEMLLPIGLALTITGRFGAVMRIVIGYASLVILAGIAISGSRTGWVATAIALLVFFGGLIRQRGYRIIGIIGLALLLVGGGWFSIRSNLASRRAEAGLKKGGEKDSRARIWPAAVNMWKDHFWWGVGPGHFDYRYRAYRLPHNTTQYRPGYVHNDYLNTLVDWGVVGFTLVLLCWACLAWGIFRSWRFVRRNPNDFGAKRSNKSAFVLGAAIGLLALLIHSFADFNMQIPANAILAVALMALIAGHFRFATERYWFNPHFPGKALATLLFLAGVAYFSVEGARRFQECAALRRADSARSRSAKYKALREAFAVERNNFETAYNIGEMLRLESWKGEANHRKAAETALKWFDRAIKLNKFDGYSYMRYGMCLHWLDRHAEAAPYFERGVALDPNGYFMRAHVGWHHFQNTNYVEAAKWFTNSLNLNWWDNQVASSYHAIVTQKLRESTNSTSR